MTERGERHVSRENGATHPSGELAAGASTPSNQPAVASDPAAAAFDRTATPQGRPAHVGHPPLVAATRSAQVAPPGRDASGQGAWRSGPPRYESAQQVPPQRGGPRGYPVERPDFEPPPPWAAPAPGAVPPQDERPFELAALGGGSGRDSGLSPRRGALVVLGLVIALVTGALGASAGVLATLKFGPPLIQGSSDLEEELPAEAKGFPKPENVATVAHEVLPSVVQIKVSSASQATGGSGFVISRDGYILTNNHVIAPAARGGVIKVTFHDSEEVSADIVGRSPSYDLAVIKVEGVKNLKPVAFGDSDKVRVGEPVVAVGSPLGLTGTVTTGIVSARNRPVTAGGGDSEMSFINALQTDAAVNPGNSGGPLVNLRAEVIGVNSAIATVDDRGPFSSDEQQGSIGLGFSIPMNQARRTAGQIIRTGHAVYPVVGAVVDVRHQGPGARLGEIQPGSAAAAAGLESGDVVTSINGHKVTGADDLIVQIRSHLPGQRVELVYERGGKQRKVIVTLGEETG